MPTSPVPFVHPSQIIFYLAQCPQTEKFCIYNPFPYDIVFKVDNPNPSIYSLSASQGLISSSNKVYIELTCTSRVTTLDGVLQVRFYRCFRPRHGHRPHVQQYVGFREVTLLILTDRSERQRTPAEEELVSLSKSGRSKSLTGSNLDSASTNSNRSTDACCSGKRFQVITNLILAIFLLLFGFIISQTDEIWFATNIGGVTIQTCAVVCYTLACVLIIRVLTIR